MLAENTHEPIISGELWHEAQKLHAKNHKESVRRLVNGEMSLFSGIIKCTDCGGNLAYTHKVFKSGISEFYKCSTYNQKGKHVCTPHKIDFDALRKAVLTDVQKYAVLAVEDEEKLIDRILKANDEFKNKNLQRYEKSIRESKNRIKEIDGLLVNLYEDKISGEITADIFKRMSQKYSEEQTTLITDLEQLESELAECRRAEQDLTGWIKRVKECLTIDVLTRAIVVELIDRIEVSEIYNADGEKNIDINIFYKFSRLGCSRAMAS